MPLTEYDIGAAFKAIEDELIASMIRNMDRHRAEETKEGIEWSMWQAEQLKALEKYKRDNQKRFKGRFQDLNKEMGELIRISRQRGNMQQEVKILDAIRKGFPAKKISQGVTAEFFRLNDRKLEALIKATTNDMQQAETAVLRMANDQYRKAIFNAQVYANSGAGTYEKAVDMATKDILTRGLNCVEYANGARHTLADYADMAIRTASKRAYLQGEGEKRQEWGITTVIIAKRGNPCPKCLPFVGKVLIDDVWSGGKKSDGPYPLMSKAIASGLYHPRCKDSHTTYFPGISTADDTWTEKELEAVGQTNKQEAGQQYVKRQAEKYGRLAEYSLSPENQKQYKQKSEKWEREAGKRYTVSDEIKVHRDDTPEKMIDLVDKYTEDEFVVLNETAEHAYAYDPDTDTIVINMKHPQYPYQDYKEIMLHELAHRIDQNEFGSPMSTEFSNAITEVEKYLMKNAERYRKMFEPGGELEYNNLISDMMGCITDNSIVGGAFHASQYIGVPGYTELEVFADIFSALYQGDDDTVKFIKDEFPDIHKAFLRVIGG
ncbi:phage minor capsid protein [Enterocloster bolteae]|jgi:hypothetical protein|nr:phage minor capsid protein [Enterocloster bolteae]MDU3289451.1 phage minor capsid protein [Enterocloster bolteae]DAE14337.1 MAG TPA: minor capsid protein [Siphoviridae sp. ct8HH20]